jgi:sialate O-acetylesterase
MIKRFILFIAVLSNCCLAAGLSLPSVFSDHMVLQRERPVPVWGKADPGAAITVEFAGQKKTATAGADGKWRVDLDPLAASSEPRELEVSSNLKSEIVNRKFSDVLVGEVWLCSGQSNMEMPMAGWLPECPIDNSSAEVAAANYPLLRLYNTPQAFSAAPKEKIDSHWNVCTPGTVKPFSACAYYFGRKLHQDLNVPVGLLLSCWGGTRIEPWIPPCGFRSVDSLANIYRQTQNMPELGSNPRKDKQTPTALYNGMLAAHIPFAIRGAIWYQGEANHWDGMLYVDKTKALLNGWRELWGYDFPFYFVQIAPFKNGEEKPAILPTFWEAEAEIVKTIPNTGMAVITDHATLNNIHPPNKRDPGIRLALLAEANEYGMKVVSTGPVFQSLEKQDEKLVVHFSSAEGLTTRDGKVPDWFEIAGADGVFKPAKAEIKDGSVILSSPEIPKPVAMRFGWSKVATPNLMNGAGLPASSFRAGNLSK